MKSRNARKVSRALRQTAKSINLGAAMAKSAQTAGEIGVASSIVINRRSQMIGNAMADPLAPPNPELARMGTEKAFAMLSIGTSVFSNFFALQRTWLNLGLVPIRLAQAMTGAMMQMQSPAAASKMVAVAAERAMADGVDAMLDVAQSGQAMVDGAMKPVHRAASRNAKRLGRTPKAAGSQSHRTR